MFAGKGSRLFDAGHALPALSVCMGNYERKYLKDAGTLYEIYCFKGHDFFSAHFKGKKAVREILIFKNIIILVYGEVNCLWSDWHWSRHRFLFMHTVGWASSGVNMSNLKFSFIRNGALS